DALSELLLEFGVETACRQPEIKRGINEKLHVARAIDPTRHRNVRLVRIERRARMRDGVIASDKIEDGGPQFLGIVRRICQHARLPRGARGQTSGCRKIAPSAS